MTRKTRRCALFCVWLAKARVASASLWHLEKIQETSSLHKVVELQLSFAALVATPKKTKEIRRAKASSPLQSGTRTWTFWRARVETQMRGRLMQQIARPVAISSLVEITRYDLASLPIRKWARRLPSQPKLKWFVTFRLQKSTNFELSKRGYVWSNSEKRRFLCFPW